MTACDDLNDGAFQALPGVETTVGRPFYPLGPHLGRLGAPGSLLARGAQACIDATVAAGGVVSLHHPSWTGNLWTGRWSLPELLRLRGYHLLEVCNHHSSSTGDVRLWTAVLRAKGPASSVGAVASDDLHRGADLDSGWVMVKVPAVTPGGLLEALRGLRFYASTGPASEFGVRGGAIYCATDALRIRFLDARDAVRHEARGPEAGYEPRGDEGFVRVECVSPAGRTAWSQAFWIS